MELVAFIILFVLGVITVLMENRDMLRFIYLPSLVVFMIIVRLNAFVFNGFEADILGYAISMQSVSLDIYYLREFVFWLGIRVIYFITNSDLISFIIMDLFWIYLLYKASYNEKYYKLNNGLLIILATSFPFLFGYENIYRQFYATVVLLFAYSRLEKRNSTSWFLFVTAIFIHNLSIFILPLFIIRRFFKFNDLDRLVISMFVSLLAIILLPYFMDSKGIISTGVDLSILYFALFFISFTYFTFKFRENVLLFTRNVPSIIPITIITIGFLYLQQEIIIERVGIMFVPFLLFDLYEFSNTFKSDIRRMGFRLLLLLLFTLPVFFSSSSMSFLK